MIGTRGENGGRKKNKGKYLRNDKTRNRFMENQEERDDKGEESKGTEENKKNQKM